MHEYSIVQSLLDLCEQNAQANGAKIVHKVVVGIGELSSVEPSLLETAFHTFKEDTMAKDAKLAIERIELKAECLSCKSEFKPSLNDYICPSCGSADTKLLAGDELLLLSLEIE